LASAARGTRGKDRASQQSFVFEVTACARGTTGKGPAYQQPVVLLTSEFKFAPFSCQKRRGHQQDNEELVLSGLLRIVWGMNIRVKNGTTDAL
jgi:hypothetical protein